MAKYCISEVVIEIIAPEWMLHENLSYFLCDTEYTDVFCYVDFASPPELHNSKVNFIVDTPVTKIYEFQNSIYDISCDKNDIPSCIIASNNWSTYNILINPEHKNKNDIKYVKAIREGLFAALREVMITVLSQKQGLIIHSSTIIWNNTAVMFSAPSVTGKTTHTNLWKQLYNVQILNGDTAACRLINKQPVVYGLPWCGTSNEFINKTLPLKAIIFLQQADKNYIEELNTSDAIMRLISRSFLLPWNKELMDKYLKTAEDIGSNANCYLLNCLPDYEAVELVKRCLQAM